MSPEVIADTESPDTWLGFEGDSEGSRPLISWANYNALRSAGRRTDRYDLLFGPVSGGPGRVRFQASKWLKMYGQGWSPVGYVPTTPPEEAPPRGPLPFEDKAELDIYFCKSGATYDDALQDALECGRFFDSLQGLRMHQSRDHKKE